MERNPPPVEKLFRQAKTPGAGMPLHREFFLKWGYSKMGSSSSPITNVTDSVWVAVTSRKV